MQDSYLSSMVFHPIQFMLFKIRGAVDYFRNVVESSFALDPASGDFHQRDGFDDNFGVETHKTARIYRLNVVGRRPLDANHYRASDSALVGQALTVLPIQREHYFFVDLGSGKGRTLIIAAQLGFAKIVGVEFSPHLVRVCNHNLKRCMGKEGMANIEVLCMDAAGFPFPPGALVVYLYNPFRGRTMRRVIENLGSSWATNPRDILIVYFSPTCERLFDREQWLQKLKPGPGLALYRSTGF